MPENVTHAEVRSWLRDYFKGRPELGLGRTFTGLVLESPNPFKPDQRRPLRKVFVLVALWLVMLAAVFAYFNSGL